MAIKKHARTHRQHTNGAVLVFFIFPPKLNDHINRFVLVRKWTYSHYLSHSSKFIVEDMTVTVFCCLCIAHYIDFKQTHNKWFEQCSVRYMHNLTHKCLCVHILSTNTNKQLLFDFAKRFPSCFIHMYDSNTQANACEALFWKFIKSSHWHWVVAAYCSCY